MAPRTYGKLLIANWRNKAWTTLSTDAQWLYGFLCSQPTTSTAGVFPIQLSKWAKGSDDMTVARAGAAARALVEHEFIVCDHDTEEGLIRSYIRDDRAGGKIFKGALSRALEVQSSSLRAVLLGEIRQVDRTLDAVEAAMVDALEASVTSGADSFVNASPSPSPSTATRPPLFEDRSKTDRRPIEDRAAVERELP